MSYQYYQETALSNQNQREALPIVGSSCLPCKTSNKKPQINLHPTGWLMNYSETKVRNISVKGEGPKVKSYITILRQLSALKSTAPIQEVDRLRQKARKEMEQIIRHNQSTEK